MISCVIRSPHVEEMEPCGVTTFSIELFFEEIRVRKSSDSFFFLKTLNSLQRKKVKQNKK